MSEATLRRGADATLGLEETTASNTGFITGLLVVLTPVLGAIFLRVRISLVALEIVPRLRPPLPLPLPLPEG
jgi:hypothetical protein